MGVAGMGARAASKLANSSLSPPTMNRFTPGISRATCRAVSDRATEAMNAFASQSLTMYSTSPAVSLDDRQVKRRPLRCAAHRIS